MKTSEISVQNPIAIAVARTPAIQKVAPWSRANAIALVMEDLPEAAVKSPPWEFNKLVEDLLSRSQATSSDFSGDLTPEEIRRIQIFNQY